MAMVKCASCGKTVSNSSENCPYCGGKVDNSVYCPRCKSADISVLAKVSGGKKSGVFGALIAILFGWLIFIVTRIVSMLKGTKVKYKCNNCGKKFKIK